MTYFEDLTPYSYLVDPGDDAVNVGWLSAAHHYPTGQAPTAAITAVLGMVLNDPVNRTRGWHRCDLCDEPSYPIEMKVDGASVYLGDCEIRVRDEGGLIYAVPSLAAHYLADHGYLPPAGFIDALCRTPSS